MIVFTDPGPLLEDRVALAGNIIAIGSERATDYCSGWISTHIMD